MQQEELVCGDTNGSLAAVHRVVPFQAAAASDGMGWVGLEAARYSVSNDHEVNAPSLRHHWLVHFARPPEELDLQYDEVKRHRPPPTGAISVIPAGTPAPWPAPGGEDAPHLPPEPRRVAGGPAPAPAPHPPPRAGPPGDGLV